MHAGGVQHSHYIMTHASTPISGTAPPLGSPRQPFTPFQAADDDDDADAGGGHYDDTVTQEHYDAHAYSEPVQQFEGHNLLNVDELRNVNINLDNGQLGYMPQTEGRPPESCDVPVDHDDSIPQSMPSPTRPHHAHAQYARNYTPAAYGDYDVPDQLYGASSEAGPAHAHRPRDGIPTPTQQMPFGGDDVADYKVQYMNQKVTNALVDFNHHHHTTCTWGLRA